MFDTRGYDNKLEVLETLRPHHIANLQLVNSERALAGVLVNSLIAHRFEQINLGAK